MILTDHRAHFAIEATLLLTPEWRCVHFDPVAAVFVRAETADALQLPAVDFATRPWQTGPDSASRPAHDPTRDPAHREAEALYLVGRSISERAGTNTKLAYELLNRAARLEGGDQQADAKSFEQLRLLGQICFSLSQLPPLIDDPRTQTQPALPEGDRAKETLAQAEEWFRKAIALRPDDFISLIYLYLIAQSQQRPDEQIRLGERILSRRYARPSERISRDRIAAELAVLRAEKDPASREDRSPDPQSRQK
jgi:tetratricopeptide (TPR) repeat protein